MVIWLEDIFVSIVVLEVNHIEMCKVHLES
jgi:hypothetical protein